MAARTKSKDKPNSRRTAHNPIRRGSGGPGGCWTPGTMEVFRLMDGHWILLAVLAGSVEVRADPFDAVPLDLTPLWGAEQEPEASP